MEIFYDYFVIALTLTYLLIYLCAPKPNIILKYPNVQDKVSKLYVDENDRCYRYHRHEIKCN